MIREEKILLETVFTYLRNYEYFFPIPPPHQLGMADQIFSYIMRVDIYIIYKKPLEIICIRSAHYIHCSAIYKGPLMWGDPSEQCLEDNSICS